MIISTRKEFGNMKESKKRQVLIVSGPSGTGKSTIVHMMVEKDPDKYELVKSVTTRKSRDDSDYYTFVTQQAFKNMLNDDAFLETNEYQGNGAMYGTPKKAVMEILEKGKIPILEIDVNGKMQVEKYATKYRWDVVSVFVTASPRVIYKRLLNRGESIQESIRRLRASSGEMAHITAYDLVVINENLNDTLKSIDLLLSGKTNIFPNFSAGEYDKLLQILLEEIDR